MSRLFHLKETYLSSIENTSSYSDREFILLNYNSKDEIDDWVRNNLSEFIEVGLVSYYKTIEPEYWVASHAKNICYKLASGDLLANLDCDNVLVKNYCEYVVELFKENIILASDPSDLFGNVGTCGLIVSRKEHFYSVNGYDEDFDDGWGVDDTSYQFRCRMQNNLKLFVQDKKYNFCIPHSNEIRTNNCKHKDIQKTKVISESLMQRAAVEKDYVANKNFHWGKAKLIKNFNNYLEI
jgi:cellulose synthase/poly-beta-1,6-N-acetylglucosamine synthase-like glycosyltransferase